MPILEKTFSLLFSGNTSAFSGPRGEISHLEDGLTQSLQNVNGEAALRVTAAWIAVTIIADEVASLTQKIVRRGDQTREPLRPPDLRALWNNEPNPFQTRFDLDVSEVLSMCLWGASYTMLGWTRAGELDERLPIHPSLVTIEIVDEAGTLRLRSAGQGELFNRPGQRPEFEFCPLYQLPGVLQPVSPVRMAAEQLGLAKAYEQTAARLMARGLQASHVLMFNEAVDREQAEDLAARLERLHGGSRRAGGIAIIGGSDPKLERLTMSMADAEFIAQNELVFQRTLALWRVPPTVAGMVDKPSTWGTGVAEFARGLERFTLRPYVMRRQAAHERYITQWVAGGEDLQVRYSFDSLLSASPKDRAEIQRLRLTAGMTSVERVLAQEDEPPFRDDETVYSQLGFATEEERDLQILERRASAAAELVRAGVPTQAALAAVGIDLEELSQSSLRARQRGRPRLEDDPGAKAIWEQGNELRKKGLTNAQVAAQLGMSESAWKRHRQAFED